MHPRSVRRGGIAALVVAALVVGLAVGGGAQVLGGGSTSASTDPIAAATVKPKLPRAGTDTMASIAEVDIGFGPDCVNPIEVHLVGDTIVQREEPFKDPATREQVIPTEMLQLDLVGYDPQLGDVTVTLNRDMPSVGEVRSPNRKLPAGSFFDVFVEVESGFGMLHNDQPVHMQAEIASIPPIGTRYEGDDVPVPLLTETNDVVGCILHAAHVPTDPATVLLKKELLALEKRLDQLIAQHGDVIEDPVLLGGDG